MLSVMMHELGHNLQFGHSNVIEEYQDRTGYMGGSEHDTFDTNIFRNIWRIFRRREKDQSVRKAYVRSSFLYCLHRFTDSHNHRMATSTGFPVGSTIAQYQRQKVCGG